MPPISSRADLGMTRLRLLTGSWTVNLAGRV
jgi:hypothetical protein